MLHHIAIATENLLEMAEFYSHLPIVLRTEWKFDASNEKRSFWIFLEDELILMLEKRSYSKFPEALIFKIQKEKNYSYLLQLSKEKTEFSFYFTDPDGNKLGFSSYPTPLKEIL
ncbi:MAG: hypothetical protein SFU98_21750 [Leptospiraceae bacterium]|nr:hypothetical protein [Leptospiraceae bacterium]